MRQALDHYYFADPPVSGSCDHDVLRLGNQLMEMCRNEGWTCAITEGTESWKEAIAAEGGNSLLQRGGRVTL